MSMLASFAPSAPPALGDPSSDDQISSRNPLKLRFPAGSHRSHKGSVTIHVPSPVVLVHPPGLGEDDIPREDSILDGTIEVVMRETRVAVKIQVTFLVTCTMHPPGKDIEERELFERTIEIGAGDPAGIKLEKGSQSFAFSIIVPSTISTYDRHPLARITQSLHAIVEGVAAPETRSFSLFSTSRKGKERSASRPTSRQPSRPGSRDVSPTRYGRRESSPAPDRLAAEMAKLGVGPSTPPLPLDDAKPLKGYFSSAKLMVVAANPLPAGGPALPTLSFRKEGRLVGVGEWKIALMSDALSVGSYIRESVSFLDPSPKATIFAVRLLLAQKYTIRPFSDPPTPSTPVVCPQRNFLVSLEGAVPDDKRPGPSVPALWRGQGVGTGKADDQSWLSSDFKIKGGLKRLPDDTKLRPSTIQGTDTPVRVSHEFILHVFFSVEGQDNHGKPLPSPFEPGEIRAMTVSIPIEIPSCLLTFDRMALPEYSAQEEVNVKAPAICACGYTLQDLASRELSDLERAANADEETDRVDVDAMALGARGRSRGREAAARKAEFVQVNPER